MFSPDQNAASWNMVTRRRKRLSEGPANAGESNNKRVAQDRRDPLPAYPLAGELKSKKKKAETKNQINPINTEGTQRRRPLAPRDPWPPLPPSKGQNEDNIQKNAAGVKHLVQVEIHEPPRNSHNMQQLQPRNIGTDLQQIQPSYPIGRHQVKQPAANEQPGGQLPIQHVQPGTPQLTGQQQQAANVPIGNSQAEPAHPASATVWNGQQEPTSRVQSQGQQPVYSAGTLHQQPNGQLPGVQQLNAPQLGGQQQQVSNMKPGGQQLQSAHPVGAPQRSGQQQAGDQQPVDSIQHRQHAANLQSGGQQFQSAHPVGSPQRSGQQQQAANVLQAGDQQQVDSNQHRQQVGNRQLGGQLPIQNIQPGAPHLAGQQQQAANVSIGNLQFQPAHPASATVRNGQQEQTSHVQSPGQQPVYSARALHQQPYGQLPRVHQVNAPQMGGQQQQVGNMQPGCQQFQSAHPVGAPQRSGQQQQAANVFQAGGQQQVDSIQHRQQVGNRQLGSQLTVQHIQPGTPQLAGQQQQTANVQWEGQLLQPSYSADAPQLGAQWHQVRNVQPNGQLPQPLYQRSASPQVIQWQQNLNHDLPLRPPVQSEKHLNRQVINQYSSQAASTAHPIITHESAGSFHSRWAYDEKSQRRGMYVNPLQDYYTAQGNGYSNENRSTSARPAEYYMQKQEVDNISESGYFQSREQREQGYRAKDFNDPGAQREEYENPDTELENGSDYYDPAINSYHEFDKKSYGQKLNGWVDPKLIDRYEEQLQRNKKTNKRLRGIIDKQQKVIQKLNSKIKYLQKDRRMLFNRRFF